MGLANANDLGAQGSGLLHEMCVVARAPSGILDADLQISWRAKRIDERDVGLYYCIRKTDATQTGGVKPK